MPASREYLIIQERTVKVKSNNAVDAAIHANAAFKGKDEPVLHEDPVTMTETIGDVRVTKLEVRELS